MRGFRLIPETLRRAFELPRSTHWPLALHFVSPVLDGSPSLQTRWLSIAIAPKRRSNGDGNTSPPKRNKTGGHPPAAPNEDAEIEATNAIQTSLQGRPLQFDHEHEIRRANSMRHSLQQDPSQTPAPEKARREGSIRIKEESLDSDHAPTAPSGADKHHLRHSRPHAPTYGDDNQQDFLLPRTEQDIATEIETAAGILQKYGPDHIFYMPAIQVLRHVCFPTHELQVRTVASKLVEHGLHIDKVHEVAMVLRQLAPSGLSLDEAANSLRDVYQLDSVLTTLQEGAPDGQIQAQLHSWREELHSKQDVIVGIADYAKTSRSVAPDRDFGNAVSQVTRSGSVLMSGGLPNDVKVEEEPTLEGEGPDDFISDRNNPGSQEETIRQQRIDKFKQKFPRVIDVLLYHLKEVCEVTADLQSLPWFKCRKVAIDHFSETPDMQRGEWKALHDQLLRGESNPLDRPAGVELLGRHGYLDRLKETVGHEDPQQSTSLATTGGRTETPSADVPLDLSSLSLEELESQFPTRRSLFLFQVFEASISAGIPLNRQDCDQQAQEFWGSFEREEKKIWSRLRNALLADGPAIRENWSAAALLSEHGLPGALAPTARDEIAPSGDGSVERSDQTVHTPDFMVIPQGKQQARWKTDFLALPYQRHSDSASRLQFVIGTPGCPITKRHAKEFRRAIATQLGLKFKSVGQVVPKRTFSVRVESPEAAQAALGKNRSVICHNHGVFAERIPDRDPQIFLCDFHDQQVDDAEVGVGVYALFNWEVSKHRIEVLKYPGNRYLICFSEPVQFLRLYVRIRLPQKQVCTARFQPVDTSIDQKCPVCDEVHAWPCKNAEAVPVPMFTKRNVPSDVVTARSARYESRVERVGDTSC